jgi:hypothetical protein
MAYHTWDYRASGIYSSSRITKEHDLLEVRSVDGSASDPDDAGDLFLRNIGGLHCVISS